MCIVCIRWKGDGESFFNGFFSNVEIFRCAKCRETANKNSLPAATVLIESPPLFCHAPQPLNRFCCWLHGHVTHNLRGCIWWCHYFGAAQAKKKNAKCSSRCKRWHRNRYDSASSLLQRLAPFNLCRSTRRHRIVKLNCMFFFIRRHQQEKNHINSWRKNKCVFFLSFTSSLRWSFIIFNFFI